MQEDDSIISFDVFSHSNPVGIHISKKLDPPVKHPWWNVWKPTMHTWIRGYPEEEGEEMEESYHGLYTDWASARMGVGWYFNQLPGEGIAYLDEINFEKFSKDAKVEFHGCKTALKVTLKGIPIVVHNFAKTFSLYLWWAGKVDATVTGHVWLSGPPKNGSYRWGPRRIYQGGEIIEEINMGSTPPWYDAWPGGH
jgi:hypothetical protein